MSDDTGEPETVDVELVDEQPRGPRDPGGRDDQIRAAFLAGDSVEEIGARHGLSRDRVESILRDQHRHTEARAIAARAVTVAELEAGADSGAALRQRLEGRTWQERVAIVKENTPSWRDRAVAAAGQPNPDDVIDPRVRALIEQAHAPETRRKYRYFGERYVDFCDLDDRTEWPGTAATLAGFAQWLAAQPVTRGKNKGAVGMAPASIRLAISAVRTLHTIMGFNPPPTNLSNKTILGHANNRAKPGTGIKDGQGAPPVKLPMLRDLVATCDLSTGRGLRDKAILCLGLAMMARRHTLAGLDLDHLRDVDERGIEVFVVKDKTIPDPSKPDVHGRTIKIPYWHAMPALCPVVAVKAWVAWLAEQGFTHGPLFRAIDQHGNLHGSAKWAGRKGLSVRMDPVIVERVVQRAAIAAHVQNAAEYTGHSLRAGGATSAYEAGADILSIANHGGWARNSPVVFRYIRDVDDWINNPMLLVGSGSRRKGVTE